MNLMKQTEDCLSTPACRPGRAGIPTHLTLHG